MWTKHHLDNDCQGPTARTLASYTGSPGFNLGPETNYPEGLRVILQSFQAKVCKLLHVRPQALSSTSLPIQHSLIILLLTLMQYELPAALLN
jgi:hypothetical protein